MPGSVIDPECRGGGGCELESQTCRARHRTSVILSQYDRLTHHGALGRLIRVVDGLESIDYRLVVVDNAEPGDWVHRVSERLIHAGGDNSCREFSAFERGVEVLERLGIETDLYILVTDAFMAYGEEYLDLVGEDAIRLAMDQAACVGWVDSFGVPCRLLDLDYSYWVRTSFVLMPAEVLRRLWPLNPGLDPAAFFVDSLADSESGPFLDTAPLSKELKARLLDWLTTSHRRQETDTGVWHSAFELNEASLESFKAKTLAILREHLTSARLASLGVPCFDLRLASRIAESRVIRRCFEAEPERWQWLAFINELSAPQPRLHIEAVHAPKVMSHGDPSRIEVGGWILGEPPVESVVVRSSCGESFVVPCSIPRPDVIAAYPEFSEIRCGFALSTELSHLRPGFHRLTLEAESVGITAELVDLVVEPRLDLRFHQAEVEGFVSADNRVTVSLEGEVHSSRPLERVEADWEVVAAEDPVRMVGAEDQPGDLFRYEVRVRAVVGACRLRFTDAQGTSFTWRRLPASVAGAEGEGMIAVAPERTLSLVRLHRTRSKGVDRTRSDQEVENEAECGADPDS
jgi:hypothetical protein